MIQVDVYSDSKGCTTGVEVKGHAGYDEYGKDIVCAAVSVLTVNMANSVEKFTDDGLRAVWMKRQVSLFFILPVL